MKRPNVSTDALLAVAGLTVLAVGLALVFPPAAFVVVGGLVLGYAVLPDQKGPTA